METLGEISHKGLFSIWGLGFQIGPLQEGLCEAV